MSIKIIHTKHVKWVDIINCDEKDLNYIKENFRFHPLDLDDVITPATRIKIDEYDGYTFLILLFPLFGKDDREIKPVEVDFFIGKDYLVTIHNGSMRTLNNIVRNVQQFDNLRSQYMTQGPGFLLFSILELLFKRSGPILDKINREMIDSGRHVFELDIKTLEKLSELKKNIIIYRRVMRMHKYVLSKLAQSKKDYLQFRESKAYFQNLIEYAENIWEVLTADKENVESFEQTNQSLGTHRINDILQVLTVISIVVSILTLVTDILIFFERTNLERNFGLTSDLQLAVTFTLILSVMTAVMLYFFRKRKWL
jgi:magnesium transporter